MRISMIDPSLFTLPYDSALVAGLADQGHEVTLHGRRTGPEDGQAPGFAVSEDFYRIAGSPAVAAWPARLRLVIKGVDHLVSMRALSHRLARLRPDVIHFQWLPLPVIDQLLLQGFARTAPLVMTVHDTDPFNGDPSARLQLHGFARCLSQFQHLIVHTAQGRARLCDMGMDSRRVAVLPHGLLAPPSRLPADPMQGELTFMLFGKIKPYKGVDVLIRAFAGLPAALQAQARVRIVGKPYMDLAPLRALAQALGVATRIRFEPGFVADAGVAELFGPGTVAVFPYREIEASGVMLLALAQGRPVVASALGAFAETLTDGVQGHLVPPGDVARLSAALAHVIDDRAFAARAAQAAHSLARAVPDWHDIARRTVTVYRTAGAQGAALGAAHSVAGVAA